jgi:hypothetical protein
VLEDTGGQRGLVVSSVCSPLWDGARQTEGRRENGVSVVEGDSGDQGWCRRA